MNNTLKNEAAIDACTALLMQKLRDLSETTDNAEGGAATPSSHPSAQSSKNEEVDLGYWLEIYAWDVIGHVMFWRSFNFLEKNGETDSGSFIDAVNAATPLLLVAGVAPSYMRTLIMLGVMCMPGMFQDFKAVGTVAEAAKQQVRTRLQDSSEERTDILSQLLARTVTEKVEPHPWFSHKEVALESWTGLMAEADSVASQMRAILYFLMRCPEAMDKAVKEIRDADRRGALGTPVSYAESTKYLPYVGACIKEASRVFPSFANSMTRVVTGGGDTLSGFHVPRGYRVEVDAAVVQHDTGLFGDDAGEFRPERWLENSERNIAMEKGMSTFGAWTLTCIGKNVCTGQDDDSSGQKLM
jgi:hypothetical protein